MEDKIEEKAKEYADFRFKDDEEFEHGILYRECLNDFKVGYRSGGSSFKSQLIERIKGKEWISEKYLLEIIEELTKE